MKIPKPKEIIKLIRSSKRPMRSRELSRRLGVHQEQRAVFKKVLRKMIDQGKVTRVKGGRYVLANKDEQPQTKKRIKGVTPKGHIMGKLVKRGKSAQFHPRDDRLGSIDVKGAEVKSISDGSLVVGEVLPPKKSQRQKVHIVDVLGKAGKLEVERDALLYEYDLNGEFSRRSLDESATLSDEITESDISSRRDLRKKVIVTIDNDKAKDYDDAVGIQRSKNGFKLYVSIADVSHYVKIGSAIDNDALERGTSVYLPFKVVTMLPEKLSDWICSLVPERDRLTKTVEINFDNNGEVTGHKIYKSIIRSKARLTYSGVSRLLEGKSTPERQSKAIVKSLKTMRELYELIRIRRIREGELNFEIPEPEIIHDEQGRTVEVKQAERTIAHGMIEEFMIAANNRVAVYLSDLNVPSVYRIHEPPGDDALSELSDNLSKLGYHLASNKKVRVRDLQKLLDNYRGKKFEIAVNMMVLRALNRAHYSNMNESHFGLGIENYTHFTSPIRRYPDLIVHRILDYVLKKRNSPYDDDTLAWIAEKTSKTERTADEVEREANNLERAYLMKSHIGEEHDAVVISVLPFGMFVELTEIYVEGLVPKESVKDWRRRWFDIGQKVRVKVVEADTERRRITLDLLS